MSYHSLQFLLFLPLVFALYWAIADRAEPRKWLLLAASVVFYAAYNPWSLLLVLTSVTIDWAIARQLERTADPKRRKTLVTISIATNVGVLASFKYTNLFVETIADLLGRVSGGAREGFLALVAKVGGLFGLTLKGTALDILLPVGLSFVVFQMLSYTIDVYRKKTRAESSWRNVVVYALFFPRVVAGPILRGGDFFPQLEQTPRLSASDGTRALLRVAKGITKKLLIADFLSANLIDRVFATPHVYMPLEIWGAVFAYSLQIYYDFSALSDIALGAAGLLGIKLKENFDRPYKATNLPEFWQRWHMSLSTWLRDFLYIPLGGNRGGILSTMRNVIITMTVGGIWHGANWRMALWGFMHGCGLALTRLYWKKVGMPTGQEPLWRKAMGFTITMLFVVLARIYFRASSMQNAHEVFAGLVGDSLAAPNLTPQVLGVMAAATALHFTPPNTWDRISATFQRLPVPVRAAALVALAVVVKKVASFEAQPFIYLQF